MKFKIASDHPVTNEAAKVATGKTLDQWYRDLDAWDGLKKGRRNINNYLYEQKIDPWWCTTIAWSTKSITTFARRTACSKDILFVPQKRSQRR